MPRRAVMVSFDLWKGWMTQGFKSGGIECTQGIPENAVLVQVFMNEHGAILTTDLVAVFESPDFEPLKDGEYTIQAPNGQQYGTFDPVFRQTDLRPEYNVYSWNEGEQKRKISVSGVGQVRVLFDWQPDHGQGSSPWRSDESCQYDVEFLC